MKKIALIAGARPNYMKIFPLWRAITKKTALEPLIIHTGQHYDYAMSKVFFENLGLPDPDVYLGVGSGSHGEQTGKVMIALEPVLREQKPNLVIVVGDVNSTVAGTLVAVKMGIPVAHIEAGLRSFDRSMPEEINRVVTDSISDLLFTSCRDADSNLLREGISKDKIHFVGNVMIDSLLSFLPKAANSTILKTLKLPPKNYILITLHRPANVDNRESLARILESLVVVARDKPVIFPAHPRTQKMIEAFGLQALASALLMIEPLGYLDFLGLMLQSSLVITDSGGIQEETTFLDIPCLTLRPNTERPITVTQGTNRLVDLNKQVLGEEIELALHNLGREAPRIEKWDGRTAERIVEIIRVFF